jgi:hypothetical protein
MAVQYLDIEAKCSDTLKQCDSVYLCLDDAWAANTVSGIALLKANIISVSQTLVECPENPADPCHPTLGVNCSIMCVYHVGVDDAQILTDIDTGLKYQLTEDDVNEIIPYVCTIDKLIALSGGTPDDWVVDFDNVSLVTDAPTGQHTFTVPVINRTDSSSVGSFDIAFKTSVLVPDVENCSMTFFPGLGDSVTVDFCDMIECCIDGETIIRNPDGTYSAVAAGSETSLTVNDTASINLTASGTMNHTLQADLKISAGASNRSTIAGDGLYTPIAAGTGISISGGTNTVAVNLTAGNGITISGATITAKTTGTWGSGRLAFTGCPTDTAGLPLYTDSSGNLRTAPDNFCDIYTDNGTTVPTAPGTDMSTAGTIFSANADTGNIVITNGSCRVQNYLYVVTYNCNVICQSSGVWQYNGLISVDGGAYSALTSTQWGTYPGVTGTTWLMVGVVGFSLAAGGSTTLRFRQQVICLVSSGAGSYWVNGNTGFGCIGGTTGI